MAAAGAAASARRAACRPDRDLGGQQDRPRRGLGRNDRGSAGGGRHRRSPGLVRLHGVGVLPSRNDTGAGAAKDRAAPRSSGSTSTIATTAPCRSPAWKACRRTRTGACSRWSSSIARSRRGTSPTRRRRSGNSRQRSSRREAETVAPEALAELEVVRSRRRSRCPRASSPEREVVGAELGVPVEVLRSILAELVGTAAA